MHRHHGLAAAAALAAALASGCVMGASEATTSGVVTSVVDGDTLDVEGVGRVRLVGIDTPEVGECGYDQARERLSDLVLGEPVTLVTAGVDDRDRYDRLLRYVDVDGADAGLVLLEEGLAVSRYDSRDGYGEHEREDDYLDADAASVDGADC